MSNTNKLRKNFKFTVYTSSGLVSNIFEKVFDSFEQAETWRKSEEVFLGFKLSMEYIGDVELESLPLTPHNPPPTPSTQRKEEILEEAKERFFSSEKNELDISKYLDDAKKIEEKKVEAPKNAPKLVVNNNNNKKPLPNKTNTPIKKK